jgi:hypothetical protein
VIHTLQGLLSTLVAGFTSHLEQWIGWATLIAAGLFGFRGGSPWMPLLVAVIINPEPYGLVYGVLHGHGVSLNGPATYTAVQIVIAYAGYALGRVGQRFR